MRLNFCEACSADGYQAMLETDDGRIELLHARTIPALREIVLGCYKPIDDDVLRVDELFERLLDSEIAFTRQWLRTMYARMNRVAA